MDAVREVAVQVCAQARDTEDARMLLDALGLLVDGKLEMPTAGVLEVISIKAISRRN